MGGEKDQERYHLQHQMKSNRFRGLKPQLSILRTQKKRKEFRVYKSIG